MTTETSSTISNNVNDISSTIGLQEETTTTTFKPESEIDTQTKSSTLKTDLVTVTEMLTPNESITTEGLSLLTATIQDTTTEKSPTVEF